jgi:hypothetical protein
VTLGFVVAHAAWAQEFRIEVSPGPRIGRRADQHSRHPVHRGEGGVCIALVTL